MSGKRIGYIRVSTPEQNPERQLEGVMLDKKFIDFASARSTERPQLKAMLEYAREDDIILVHSMDRLARNVFDLKKVVEDLVSRKIQIHFLKENLKFTGQDSPMSNLLLSVMGAFAEFEYAFIKERQKEGIAIAKGKGKYKGSRSKFNPEMALAIEEKLKTRESKSDIAKSLGISRFSLYAYIKRMNRPLSEGLPYDL